MTHKMSAGSQRASYPSKSFLRSRHWVYNLWETHSGWKCGDITLLFKHGAPTSSRIVDFALGWTLENQSSTGNRSTNESVRVGGLGDKYWNKGSTIGPFCNSSCSMIPMYCVINIWESIPSQKMKLISCVELCCRWHRCISDRHYHSESR